MMVLAIGSYYSRTRIAGVAKQSLDASCFAGQTSHPRHFLSDLARMHTTALVHTCQQPDEIALARNPFIRSMLADQLNLMKTDYPQEMKTPVNKLLSHAIKNPLSKS